MYVDFNVSGDPLSSANDHIATECILGLRIAANNIFHCDLSQLRRHLSVQCQQLFTLKEVMKYLASQKRKSLGLGIDATVLQVITVDELQLVFGQSEVLRNNSRKLVDILVGNLANWMISGKWHARQHEAFQLLVAACVSLLTLCSFWHLSLGRILYHMCRTLCTP